MENNISSQTTNYIIVGNKEGLFFDSNSLQRYVTIQGSENGNKPLFPENPSPVSKTTMLNNIVKANGLIGISDNDTMSPREFNTNCHMEEISTLKKPCPLEMSIKAADLDTEFNDNCFFVQDGSGQYIQLSGDRPVLSTNINGQELNINQPKILSNVNSSTKNGVELRIQDNVDGIQVVDQAGEKASEAAHNISQENDNLNPISQVQKIPNTSSNYVSTSPALDLDFQHNTKKECDGKKNLETKKLICEVVKKKNNHKERKKSVPLVLKIRKVKHKIKTSKCVKDLNDEEWERVKPKRKRAKLVKSPDSECSDWHSSDEETLDATSKRLHTIAQPVVKCCPRICNKKIQRLQQDAAFSYFTELEKKGQGDRYLGNCVHLKITSPEPKESLNVDEDDAPLSPWPNYDQISEEIANESNGNQLLSDEIKNAINESLKDQESSNIEPVEVQPKPIVKLIPKKARDNFENYNNTVIWTYYIVAKNRQRPVCLKFLLKTLNIDESRIEEVRKRILSGDELDRIQVSPTRSKLCKSWDIASQHLETLPTKAVPYCRMSPPHMYFVKPIDRRTLYHKFCRYHQIVTGSEIVPKIESYRRFLLVNSNIVFPRRKETSCAGCDISKTPTDVKSPNSTYSLPNASDKRRRKKDQILIKETKVKSKKTIKISKKKLGQKRTQRGDVFSLMLSHLKSLPANIPTGCRSSERHRFFSPNNTTVQSLYDDYRRYFLKCTNSELGLRFAIYESLFLRNPLFEVAHLNENSTECPKCANSGKNLNTTDLTTAKK